MRPHAPLERSVDALQLLRRHHALGRVDHGDDHAAIGHGARAELEHLPRIDALLAEHLMRQGDLLHPVIHRRAAAHRVLEEGAQHLGDRGAHPASRSLPSPRNSCSVLFQQMSVMPGSNTASPWSTLSIADCSRSRLC